MQRDTSPQPAAWALFFLSPFLWPDITPAPIAVDLMSLGAGLLAALWSSRFQLPARPMSAWSWLVLLLIVMPAFVRLLSGDAYDPWLVWRQSFYYTAAFLVFVFSTRARALVASSQWSALFAIAAHLFVLYAIVQAFDLRFLAGERLFPVWSMLTANFPGPLMQRNFQALFLSLAVLLILRRIHDNPAWVLAIVLPVAGIILTASRGGALMLLLAVAGAWFFSPERNTTLFRAGLAILVGAGLASWVSHAAPTTAAPQSLAEHLAHDGIDARLFIWDTSWQIFLMQPWFGVGWGNLAAHGAEGSLRALAEHPQLAEVSSRLPFAHVWSHNLLLQGLAEGGVFGGLLVLLLILALFRQGWRLLHRPCTDHAAITAWLATGMMLVHGMFSVAFLQGFFLVLFAFFMAGALREDQAAVPASASFGLLLLAWPAAFLAAWLHIVLLGNSLKQIARLPLHDTRLIQTVGACIDDPWLHHSGLRAWFRLLTRNPSTAGWANSEMFARTWWHKYAYAGTMEIMVIVKHSQGDLLAETRWIERLNRLMPHSGLARELARHMGHPQGADTPLSVRMLW